MEKASYGVELNALYKAKLAVLAEEARANAPHAPITEGDILNKALAAGIDAQLRAMLPDPHYPRHLGIGTVDRVGDVFEIID